MPESVQPHPAELHELDGRIVSGLAAQDPDALAALYDRYAGYAMAVAMRILRDRSDAEETVQDTFCQIWTGRVRYDPQRGRFRTWVFTVARSRALDRLRQRESVTRLREAVMAQSEIENAEDNELSRDMRACLALLGDDQRSAIELAYYEGMSHSEIADRLGDPIGTVKSRIRRGLLQLRSSLSEKGGGS